MDHPRPWIAYVGPFLFPWGQSGSRRVYGMARSLAGLDYDVVVGGGAATPSELTRLADGAGPGSVSYLGLGERPATDHGRLARSAQVWGRRGAKTVDWLDTRPTRPSFVVVYGGAASYLIRLRRWCRRHRIPLIADVVEWHQPTKSGAPYLSAMVGWRHQAPRCDGVIAVSSFLTAYFRHRGTPVVRIPPTVDTTGLPVSFGRGGSDGLVFVYSGTPGRKDLLATMIAAMGRFTAAGGRGELRVLGPSAEEIRRLIGGAVPPAVRPWGTVPQPEVGSALRDADFSIVLRERSQFSVAGFPIAFCESLAAGTPVIANITSDVGDYLCDGREGLVCRDHTEDALLATLWRAARLNDADLAAMRQAARLQAERSFDFRVYEPTLGSFLDGLGRGESPTGSPVSPAAPRPAGEANRRAPAR